MKTPTQVVSAFLKAVQQGNNQQLAALIDPEITWNQPGNHQFSGTKHVAGAVFKMVAGMYEATNNSLTLTDIVFTGSNGNKVACLLRFTASCAGKRLNSGNIDVYTIANGKIVNVSVYVDDTEHEDDFWDTSMPS